AMTEYIAKVEAQTEKFGITSRQAQLFHQMDGSCDLREGPGLRPCHPGTGAGFALDLEAKFEAAANLIAKGTPTKGSASTDDKLKLYGLYKQAEPMGKCRGFWECGILGPNVAVERENFCQRMGNSLCGVCFGILLFLGSIFLLGWNEFNYVRNQAILLKVDKEVIEAGCVPSASNVGKL
ncbi:unnamed protein product, partial [Cladocopium goreaui]